MQEIFAFQRTGVAENGAVRGHFAATGIRPNFMDALIRHGVELSPDVFAPNRKA
jgi:pilus assembly protein CpaF